MKANYSTRSSLLARVQDAARARSREGSGGGHAAVWEEFVRIYAPQVLLWCRTCGLQDCDAADVCQDVLVRFWKQAARFEYDPSRRFRGYLRQILTAALSGWAGSMKLLRPVDGTSGESLLDSIPAREQLIERIEQAYDTELLHIAIEDVKTRVKPHTWRAFEIMAIEQRPGSEAVEELGISADLVYAARRNVQKMLKEAVARLERGAPK